METEVLIIGAGLAGLSAGYHLKEVDHTIVESDPVVGGLCKSFQVDGFHFDCTGHLMHFRTPEGKKIITGLVGHKIREHQRKAAIFLEGRFTDYPFQANTYGLPPEIVKDCLLGFVKTLQQKHKSRINNFQDWIYDTFGDGIAKYFMVPYNEKLWQHDLHDIALDWVNWSIPKPNLEDVINGALGIKNRQFGYNPVFYYPANGGIGLLPNSFPVRGKLILDQPVEKIYLKKRKAILRDGTAVRFRYLLSTMPLHAFLSKWEDAPSTMKSCVSKLQFVSVLNINLGIDRENVIPYHWVYFPERNKPFYRIGCTSNFSDSVAPKGTSALFVEVSLRSDIPHDIQKVTENAIQALKESKILLENDRLLTVFPILLKYAYVIYNSDRKKTVDRIQRHLAKRGAYSFGRYGSWIYSSMEDAVLQGKEFAETVLSRREGESKERV
jgi:protoporphyrinogen oxidase